MIRHASYIAVAIPVVTVLVIGLLAWKLLNLISNRLGGFFGNRRAEA